MPSLFVHYTNKFVEKPNKPYRAICTRQRTNENTKGSRNNHYIRISNNNSIKYIYGSAHCHRTQQQSNSSSQSTNSSATSSPLKTIFKDVENSIVQITSKIPTGNPNALNPQSQNATALGSGFVYDKDGHIVTNAHVVGDAKIVDVTFVDGNRYTAKVIGTDIYGDITVLQISENNTQQQQLLSTLKPLVIGNSSNLEVGDQVIAIGNPFGLSDTMTTGIVSGVSRSLPAPQVGDFLYPIQSKLMHQ